MRDLRSEPFIGPAIGPAIGPSIGFPPPKAARVAANAAQLLARFVFLHAHAGPVRAMEAVAATVVNQVARDGAAAGGGEAGPLPTTASAADRRALQFRSRLLAAGVPDPAAAADPATPAFAACLRIARRAVAGALKDPTGGATLFHPLGGQPAWARQHVPTAVVGGLLFYREEPAVPPGAGG